MAMGPMGTGLGKWVNIVLSLVVPIVFMQGHIPALFDLPLFLLI